MSASSSDALRQVTDHPWFRRIARLGYIANAVLHAMLGVLALTLAQGGNTEADQSGAMQTLAQDPWGMILLWFCALSAALLGLWSIAQAVMTQTKATRRFKVGGTGLVFIALSGAFFQFATGHHSDSGQTTSSISSVLMQSAGGRFLLIALGLGLIGIGGYFIFRGISRRFLEDIDSSSHVALQKAITISGALGYPAKGLVLAAVGLLFISATVQNNPEDSTGLDGALKAVRDQDFGPTALALVGAGLLAYAVYLAFRSRYDSMDA
ncbi:DUF1206 domain-containing protein [Glutamicibacter sp.]|uniref:DUF1206 domain-containing protein n=1 Tax=Glutamicibacter sp. TaxID=1931995 RepID=UPI0028BE23AB|nr:DUF1206 domain-containing protein [Glutamicibacter sp.]